jgi:hypothetical protein
MQHFVPDKSRYLRMYSLKRFNRDQFRRHFLPASESLAPLGVLLN